MMKQLKKDHVRHTLAVTAFALALSGVVSGCAEEGHAESTTVQQATSITSSLRTARTSAARTTHQPSSPARSPARATTVGRPNTVTDFVTKISMPKIDATAYIDPNASVIGDVEVGPRVYFAPFSSARGDEGVPIHIGRESNLQDGVVVHALETFAYGAARPEHTYVVNGQRYAVYIGERVSLAHQSHVHGPAWIEDDVFVGMQSLIFKAHVEKGVVIEPAVTIIGVTIPAGRYVPAGSVVTSQAVADALPRITQDYGFRTINEAVVHVNTSLADGYGGNTGSNDGHASSGGGH